MALFDYLDPSSVAPDLLNDSYAYAAPRRNRRRLLDGFGGTDPFAQGDPLDSILGPIATQPRQAAFPRLEPEIADSFLSQLGGAAVGGLQWIGETLDKPGAAVRGLLAGRPDQLLNLIPFSDTLGITKPSERTSGRDLLESYGFAPKNIEGFNPFTNPVDALGDAAGLAIEVVTDPLFWITGPSRALTSAGQQAAKQGMVRAPGFLDDVGRIAGRDTATLADHALETGKLAPTTASRIAAGQGGIASLWNPFGDNLVFGTGPRAQAFAESVIDPIGNSFAFNPIVNPIRRMLSAGAGNASMELGQRIGQDIAQPSLNAADFRTAKKTDPVLSTVAAEGLSGPHIERAMDLFATNAMKQGELDALGRVATGVSSLDQEIASNPKLAELFSTNQAGERIVPDDLAVEIPKMIRAAEVGRTMAKSLEEYVPAFRRIGIDKQALVDNFLAYLPRHVYEDPKQMTTAVTATLKPMSRLATDFLRVPFLKDIPLGRESINDMVKDLRVSGPIREGSITDDADAVRTILSDYLGFPDEDLAKATTWRDGKSNYDHAVELQRWLRGLSADYADAGKDLFNAHPVLDFFLGVRSAERKLSQADSLLELVSRVARPGQQALDDISVRELMNKGLTNQGFDLTNGGRAQVVVRKKISDTRGIGKRSIKLGDWYIPREYANDIDGYLKAINSSDAHSTILDAADYWQSRFKGLATVPWPSFHVRNLTSGMFYNLAAGKMTPQSMADAFEVMAGRPVSITLTSGEVLDTGKITELAHGAGAIRSSNYVSELNPSPDLTRNTVTSTPHSLPQPTGDMTKAVPIADTASQAPIAPGRVTNQLVPATTADVLLGRPTRAFMTTPDSKLSPNAGIVSRAVDAAERNVVGRVMNAGASIGQNVEDFNRLTHFIEALKQGFTPEEATLSVKKWQFDYRPEAYTWTERNVMKRLIPFFSFMKNNLYLIASELTQNPGGRIGQSIRAANTPNEGAEGGFTPGYISTSTHIPLGAEENGTRKFITSLGLPFSEPLERLQFGPTIGEGIRRTAESWLATLRPELKGPLEQLANRSFFFGRPLDKIYSMTGYQPADQLLMNSPLTRFATTYRQLVDPRKTLVDQLLNLGTGIKISDIDMNAARRDAEDNLKTILNASPRIKSFEEFYVPSQNMPFLSPDEHRLMRLYYTEAARKRDEAAARRKRETR